MSVSESSRLFDEAVITEEPVEVLQPQNTTDLGQISQDQELKDRASSNQELENQATATINRAFLERDLGSRASSVGPEPISWMLLDQEQSISLASSVSRASSVSHQASMNREMLNIPESENSQTTSDVPQNPQPTSDVPQNPQPNSSTFNDILSDLVSKSDSLSMYSQQQRRVSPDVQHQSNLQNFSEQVKLESRRYCDGVVTFLRSMERGVHSLFGSRQRVEQSLNDNTPKARPLSARNRYVQRHLAVLIAELIAEEEKQQNAIDNPAVLPIVQLPVVRISAACVLWILGSLVLAVALLLSTSDI